MVENRPWLTLVAHLTLILGVFVIAFPLWMTFVASTHDTVRMLQAPAPVWPGSHLLENYGTVLLSGLGASSSSPPVALMMWNSLVMAVLIAVGKIAISIISAYAIVYFRFRFRMAAFWAIFVTLMLPVEVRIFPTYEVIARLDMLNSYGGLTVPLIASATGTFLFRQFFMTVPDELAEAARIDGAGPLRFFKDVLLPLSWTNIAALFVIQFVYGWNQYLWPLIIATDESWYTVVMGISRMVNVVDAAAKWNLVMATTMLAMIPPVIVVVAMQGLFVKGLVETEK